MTGWEAAFIAESIGRSRPPYVPHDLLVALDDAPAARVEEFLTELHARTGEDISSAELWAMWHAASGQPG